MGRKRRDVIKVLPEWDDEKAEESTDDEREDEEEDEEMEEPEEQAEDSEDEDYVVDAKEAEEGVDQEELDNDEHGQEEELDIGEDDGEGEDLREAEQATKRTKHERKKITIKLKGSKQCKVCKKFDHQAGFLGSVYIDCPNKPCYLCKKPGHTTMTCPHRIATDHGVTPVPQRHALGLLDFVADRQLKGHRSKRKMSPIIPSNLDAALIHLHSRRVTHVEFHPTRDNIVISGDKKGQIGIWDFESVVDKTVYKHVHSCLVNSIKFHPINNGVIYTSSSDGTVNCTDLETGVPSKLLDMNPDGWHGPSSWKMMYAMDVNSQRNVVLAADNFGFFYQLDMRTGKEVDNPVLMHKKGTKIVGVNCNPVDPDIFLTCGNDHMARVWDLRLMDSKRHLAELSHPRVVNSAYFSPVSGSKIMTTCQDNRIRVWDCLFGDLEEPSREIVHSHDFNRYVTAFRAEWDPKDPTESLVVIGRYISDDYDGVALHPVDFIDISTGQLVAEVVDKNVLTIVSVNKLHPRQDVMVSGSSRSLFLWRPNEEDDEEEGEKEKEKDKAQTRIINLMGDNEKKGRGKGKTKFDDDDDDDDFCAKKSTALPSKKSRSRK
ncbi:unnamed protein product [Calypogeia fissa]